MLMSQINDLKLRERIAKALQDQDKSPKWISGSGIVEPKTSGAGSESPHAVSEASNQLAKGDRTALVEPAVARVSSKLNKTEARYRDRIRLNYGKIFEQAITLAIDPPFRSYRPDLAAFEESTLHVFEVKAEHRFKEKGIAKAALAAKQWPNIVFHLALWTINKVWKESILPP